MALIKRSELLTRTTTANRELLEKSAKLELLVGNMVRKSEGEEVDVFLSHSFLDALEVKQIKEWLEGEGLTTYIDWLDDAELSRDLVSAGTAETLKVRMSNCKSLVFITSENSTHSKWMPWELGYFDALGKKIAILPINEDDSTKYHFQGQEYLGLYPYIDRANSNKGFGPFFWVNDSNGSKAAVRFKTWIGEA